MTLTSKGGYGFAGLSAVVLAASMVFFGCSQEQASQSPPSQQPAVEQQAGPATAPQKPVVVSPEDRAKAKEHFMKGIQFDRGGKLDEAINEYEASIKLNPNSPDPISNLGYAYYYKGYIDNAIGAQLTAIKMNPELASAYYGLGLAFEKKGDKKHAITAWQQYISRAEPHTKYWISAQEHLAKLEGRKMKKIDLTKSKKTKKPAAPAKESRSK
ncbi:MAG: tetratricopeptide repeat protein [Deltaproteobacteria bacterium]|nr:tetratricopeptide repeat protein [Deltaproteobacteria bacterium]